MPDRSMDAEVLRKLDGGLRRLLQMEDAEIKKMVDFHHDRIEKRISEKKPTVRGGEENETGKKTATKMAAREAYRADLLPDPVFGAVIIEEIKPLRIRIRAIIRFTGNKSDLESLGLKVGSQAQDIFTVTGTKNQLAELALQPATQHMNLPRLFLPTVENASAQGEIAAVHVPHHIDHAGFRGQGVIVGIVDSPLDVTHHGFRNPTEPHDSRVLYYWVQEPCTLNTVGNPVPQPSAPGQDPDAWHAANHLRRPHFGGLDYGRIYDRAAVTAAVGLPGGAYGTGATQICCQPGIEEHGTHTAGIAAGNGLENNWDISAAVHIGAAPDADIIHVQNRGLEDDVIHAIDFIFRASDFHRFRPVVVSISLSNNLGPHNGMSLFDQYCDNMLNSHANRAIVISAGNGNNWDGFRMGTIAAGESATITMTPSDMDFQGHTDPPVVRYVDIWYRGPELHFEVRCGTSTTGLRTERFDGTLNGHHVTVEVGPDPSNTLKGIRLCINEATTHDICTILLSNQDTTEEVEYYAWSAVQPWCASLNDATNNEMTIAETGCGRSTITVGSCEKLHDDSGLIHPNPSAGEVINALSGAGPTLDGRIKPEIVAVGGGSSGDVFSANSDQASGYIGMSGTSMATPLVAGAVALLFNEYVPLHHDLTHDTVKAILTQNANRLGLHVIPSVPGYVANERNRYGYGRLRLLAPMDRIANTVYEDVWIRKAEDDYGFQPYPGDCFWASPDIRVCQPGTDDEVSDLRWGSTYDVKVVVRNMGDIDANNTTVQLRYTLPGTAPDRWILATDAGDNLQIREGQTIPALGQQIVTFTWRPKASDFPDDHGDHFCLLAETWNLFDGLTYPLPTRFRCDAWALNIKRTNNVALHNVNIQ